jgi:O-antigen/teichoic acid export membrane protein
VITRSRTEDIDWPDARHPGAVSSSGLRAAAASWARFVVQFSAMVTIARLIDPGAYGAAATLLVAVTGAEVIRCGGVTWLIAHETRLTPGAASTLHRLSQVAGAAVAGVWCLVAALPVADGLPGGRWGPLAMAVVFLAAGSGAVPTAVLGRNLRTGTVGMAELVAAVLSAVAGTALAGTGGGATALLLQAVVYAVVLRAGIAVVSPWRPGRRVPVRDLRAELAFVGNACLTQLLEWAARSLDRVVVAVVFGHAAAGFYVQASQLVILPLEQVTGPLRRIAVPVLGRLRKDPERFRRTLRDVLTVACAVLWPAFAVLGVLGPAVIGLVFGTDWLGTVPVFRAMLPAALALVVVTVTVVLAHASGAAAQQARWELRVSRPLTVLAFLGGAPLGFRTMVLAVSLATVAAAVPGFLVVARRTPARPVDLARAVWAPALLAVACGGTAAVTRHAVPQPGPALALATGACLVVWGLGLLAVPTTRRLALRAVRRDTPR